MALSNSAKALILSAAVAVAIAVALVATRRDDAAATPGAGTSQAARAGGKSADGSAARCDMTPCEGNVCDTCTTQNCIPSSDGCGRFTDATDKKLCEDLYACITDPANHCTNQGDPVRCWCGSNPTTCLNNATGPKAANGPCLQQILAAAKSADPEIVRQRFVDAVFPLGRAVRLSSCRGSFCSTECAVP